MPGRDITRLLNRAARVLFLLSFVIWAGPQVGTSAWSQSAAPQSDGKPSDPAPATTRPTTPQPTQEPQQKPESQDKKLEDQGVFVFKKDVDEVLLHATVQDDKNHIVTNLDRGCLHRF